MSIFHHCITWWWIWIRFHLKTFIIIDTVKLECQKSPLNYIALWDSKVQQNFSCAILLQKICNHLHRAYNSKVDHIIIYHIVLAISVKRSIKSHVNFFFLERRIIYCNRATGDISIDDERRRVNKATLMIVEFMSDNLNNHKNQQIYTNITYKQKKNQILDGMMFRSVRHDIHNSFITNNY